MSPVGLQVTDPHAPPPPVEQCDVSKPQKLAEYRSKREEWSSLYGLGKKEPNNIKGQIARMIFFDIGYRILTKPSGDIPQDVNIAARNGFLRTGLDAGCATGLVTHLSLERSEGCGNRRFSQPAISVIV